TLAHFLDLDLEHRVRAGHIGRTISRRERHRDGAVLAWLRTDELVLEARDESSRTELDRNVLALAARKHDIASPANEIDDGDVAVFRRPLDRLRFALRFTDPLDRAVDVLLRHLGDQPLDPEIGEIRLGHVGQQLDRHLIFEVGAFRGRHDLDPGRQGRTQVLLAHRLGRAALDRALQHFVAHRRTVALAQQRQRHLARTEAGDADGLADLAEPAADLILDLSGRNGDLELALQPLGAGLGYLHCGLLTLSI